MAAARFRSDYRCVHASEAIPWSARHPKRFEYALVARHAHAFDRRTRQIPTATIAAPPTLEPRTRFNHLTVDPASLSPRPIRERTRRRPMAMSVPPVETKRKPRNSPVRSSAFDDFMNLIVAVEVVVVLRPWSLFRGSVRPSLQKPSLLQPFRYNRFGPSRFHAHLCIGCRPS